MTILDQLLEYQRQPNLTDHITRQIKALYPTATDEILDGMHPILGDRIIG